MPCPVQIETQLFYLFGLRKQEIDLVIQVHAHAQLFLLIFSHRAIVQYVHDV